MILRSQPIGDRRLHSPLPVPAVLLRAAKVWIRIGVQQLGGKEFCWRFVPEAFSWRVVVLLCEPLVPLCPNPSPTPPRRLSDPSPPQLSSTGRDLHSHPPRCLRHPAARHPPRS